MGLRESRIINSVHPWLGARLRWLGEVAEIVGSKQSLISGNRTREEQRVLYDSPRYRTVAFPGCSQHQYGFAADAKYDLIINRGGGFPFPKAPTDVVITSPQETDRFFNNAARHVGLHLVAGDQGHLQVYNGLEFRNWAVGFGLCNPNPPPRPTFQSFPLRGGLIDQYCGPGFTSLQIRPTGFVCGPPSEITSLIGE